MSKTKKPRFAPLALINDEPVAALNDDRLGLAPYADTVAAVVIGTEGPFTIGVFGDWGHGKTSLLRLAKARVDTQEMPNVTSVWFNAWQYEKEEHPIVPLTATIIRALEEKLDGTFTGKLKSTATELVRSLRSVVFGFSAKAKVGVPGLGEIEIGADPKKMIERYEALKKQSIEPLLDQSLYYNAFQLLEKVHDPKAKRENRLKIVVFIDDLDRCLPENALHLLESLKLVLAQPGFIFALAVDHRIVQGYLNHRYKEKYGIKDYEQGQSYLDKIIQLPFHVPSHQSRFEEFVKKTLDREELNSLKSDFEPLQKFIGQACNHNPRELVRFLNRMLIDQKIWTRVNPNDPFDAGAFAVARSLQMQSEKAYSALIKNLDLCQDLANHSGNTGGRLIELRGFAADQRDGLGSQLERLRNWTRPLLNAINDLLGRRHLCELLDTAPGKKWLEDQKLRTQIEEFLEIQRPEAPERDSAEIIDAAIRKATSKPTGPLTDDDLKDVHSLDLSNEHVTDLTPIQKLKNLQELYLRNTQVTDLTPIQKLENLVRLDIGNTQVTDLMPIRNLPTLEALYLNDTQVIDLTPIRKLQNLEVLVFSKTQVTDLGPIQKLVNLKGLGLNNTQVTDLMPIQNLLNLETLDLVDTQVTDLTSIQKLVNLRWLGLDNTQVTDLTPIQNLKNLKRLFLSNIKVTDLTPIQKLVKLEKLNLNNSQVTDLTPIQNLENLREVHLDNTQVTDLTPLRKLQNLRELRLEGTPVSAEQIEWFRTHRPNVILILSPDESPN